MRQERKVVTVLFADLVGFTARAETMDPEDVTALLSPYHARLRTELERHGGTVEKFIGAAVMAVFGAAVAHEDDPERAVRAALTIRDWIVDEGELEVRIGVATGEALVSLEAHPEAGEGMAAGDVVNTAARLQAAAPVNGILVGEQTFRATRHVIDYCKAAPVEAKGKARRSGLGGGRAACAPRRRRRPSRARWAATGERRAFPPGGASSRRVPELRGSSQPDLVGAVHELERVGSVADGMYARLQAAERLVADGRRPDADEQLARALAFYRSVGATVYVRDAKALLAASA